MSTSDPTNGVGAGLLGRLGVSPRPPEADRRRSRGVRWLLMLAVVLIGAVLVIATVARLAEPSSDAGRPTGGGRIVQPEHGFAVEFPSTWQVREAGPAWAALRAGDGPPLTGEDRVLVAGPTDSEDACVVGTDDPGARGDPMLLADRVSDAEAAFEADEAAWQVERTRHDLPAGRAWRIEADGDRGTAATYVLRGPDAMVMLACTATDPPADRWLSIARSLELLAADTDAVPAALRSAASPVLRSGRVERPGDGFAVRFPEDWTLEEITPDTHAWLTGDTDADALARRSTLLYADQPAADGYCTVVDFARLAGADPVWRTVEDATEGFLAGLVDVPGFVDPESTYLELPAGRTGLITMSDADGWAYGAYYFSDADAWFYLQCWSVDPEAADWTSIAQTFEFLPTDT